MILQLGGLLLVFCAFTYAGYGIVQFLLGNVQPRSNALLVVSLSFALGLGIIALGTILTSLLGIGISIPLMVVFLLPGGIAHLLSRRRKHRTLTRETRVAEAGFSSGPLLPVPVAVLILTVAVLVAFVGTLQEPIAEVDAIAHWAFHAKVFLVERSALPEFLTSGAGGRDISHWPPLLPLIQTWSHLGMGGYDERLVKLVFPVIYLAMLGLFYGSLRRHLSREFCLSMTVLLATLPAVLVPFPAGSIASAYADLPMALFTAAVSCLLFLWVTEKQCGPLILAALFAAAAIWVKREGIAFALVSTIAVGIFSVRRRERSIGGLAAWTAILTASSVLQLIYKSRFPGPFSGEPIDPGILVSSVGLLRILASGKGIALEAINPARWGFLWILLGLTVLLRARCLRQRVVILPLLLLVGQIGMAMAGMAVSEFSTERIAALDIRRFLIQIAPIGALSLTMITGAAKQSAEPGDVRRSNRVVCG